MNDDATLMLDGHAATHPRRIGELDPVTITNAAIEEAIKMLNGARTTFGATRIRHSPNRCTATA